MDKQTDQGMADLLHSASRVSVLVVLDVAAMFLIREVAPQLAEPESDDARYFQGRSGMIRPEDATVQVKRIAAARGLPVDSVRQLVTALEAKAPDLDLRTLNQARDTPCSTK